MPLKDDADQALQMLEQYRSRLKKAEDAEMRNDIDAIMNIFKSDFFSALIDIQEYYELMTQPNDELTTDVQPTSVLAENAGRVEVIENHRNWHGEDVTAQEFHNSNPPLPEMYEDLEFTAYEYEDIILERGSTGLGFSIAGGSDNPLEGEDSSIYITKILPSGAAADDGRLRVNDAIISVNGVNTLNVQHKEAVDALKMCQSSVRLVVRRIPQSYLDEHRQSTLHRIYDFNISKGTKGLGFSIAGGLGNQHIPGDNGIFITKIINGGAAEDDGRLQPGDKILEVDGVSLIEAPHEAAVSVLKSTKELVYLKILRTDIAHDYPEPLPRQSVPPNNLQSNDVSAKMYHAEQEFPNIKPWDDMPETEQLPPSSNLPLEETVSSNIAQDSHIISQFRTKVHSDSSSLPNDIIHDVNSYTEQDNNSSNRSGIKEEVPRGPRTVCLFKGPEGMGFSVVGGEDGQGLFISCIHETGVAYTSGLLYQGDHILAVNDIEVGAATNDEAVKVLQSTGDFLSMIVEHKPSEYKVIEEAIEEEMMNQSASVGILTSQKKTLYVRALFDYDSSRDSGLPGKGLSFQLGDVLHVTNASDDEWWQARRVERGNDSSEFGVIPSKSRVERKERARLKQVKFTPNYPPVEGREQNNVKRKKSVLFSRKFPFYKSRENLDEVSDQENNVPQNDLSSDSEKDVREEVVLSYEKVTQKRVKYARPIIILGPFKDRINDDLIAQEPEVFGSCVPHTTRPKRDNENDGSDYHFVISREQMEKDIQDHLFIEAGQYNENLYGTSVQSVRDVAESYKHCILDVSGSAIKRLQVAELWPIAVFIKPRSVQWLMELNKRLVEEQAKKMYERAMKSEQEYGEYFTAVVQGDTIDEIYNEIKLVIQSQSGPIIWIPVVDENS